MIAVYGSLRLTSRRDDEINEKKNGTHRMRFPMADADRLSAADMMGMRGFNGGDVLSRTTLTGIGALCVRLRIGAD